MTQAHLVRRRADIDNIDLLINPSLLGLTLVEISLSELCNRTCSFCPRGMNNSYPNRNLNMTVETATALIAQLDQSNYEGSLCLSGYGEPTLNPDFFDICNILKSYSLELITNGDNILKGKITIDQIYDAVVKRVLISDYDRNPIWESFKYKYPQLIVRDHYDDGTSNLEEYNFNNREGALQGGTSAIKRPCFIPSYKVVVDWNGDVIKCCHSWLVKKVIGNIFKTTLSEIWMGEEFSAIRKSLIKGNRIDVPSCRKCDVKGDVFGIQQAKLWEK